MIRRNSLLATALVATILDSDRGLYPVQPRLRHDPVDTRPSDKCQAEKLAAAEAKRARKLARNAAIAAQMGEKP